MVVNNGEGIKILNWMTIGWGYDWYASLWIFGCKKCGTCQVNLKIFLPTFEPKLYPLFMSW